MTEETREEQEERRLQHLMEELQSFPLGFGIMTQLGYQDLMRRLRRLGELVVLGMTIQLLVIGYVFYTDYRGRERAILASREGCERDKLDRTASVVLNKNILIAFQETDKNRLTPPSHRRMVALNKINATTAGLDARARINCVQRYPEASLFP